MIDHTSDANHILQAEAFWERGEGHDALSAAWAAFDRSPASGAVRRLLARLLAEYPDEALPQARRADYLSLLTDPAIELRPGSTARGWRLLMRTVLSLSARGR